MSLAALERGLASPQGAPEQSYLEGLGRSFAASFPEMIGVQPSDPVLEWRAQHPVSALGADLAAFMIPYGGWLKVASKVPGMAKALALADKATNPAVAGAAREIVRFAPFEAARVAATEIIGKRVAPEGKFAGTDTEVKHAIIDVAGAAALGGAFGAVGAFGKRVLSGRARPGADIGASMQEQIQQLQEALPRAKDPEAVKASIARLRQNVLTETAGKGKVYISALDGVEEKSAVKDLNRLFAPTKSQGRAAERKTLTVGPKASQFGDAAELSRVMDAAGLTDAEHLIQSPRFVQPLREGTGQSIGHAIRKALSAVDGERGWFWGRDPGDGLYVMAKRLQGKPQRALQVVDAEAAKRLKLKVKGGLYVGGVEDNASLRRIAGDPVAEGILKEGWIDRKGQFTTVEPKSAQPQWVLFKTNNPGHFLPENKAFADAAVERSGVFGLRKRSRVQSTDPNAPTSVHDAVARVRDNGMVDYRGLLEGGDHQVIRKKIAAKLGFDKLADSELAQRAVATIDATVVPTMFQFRNHPAAAWLVFGAKQAKQQADAVAERLFLGHRLNSPGATPLGVIYNKPTAAADSIDRLVDDLFANPKSVEAFQKTAIAMVSPSEGVKQFGLSPRGEALLNRILEIDDFQVRSVLETQKLVGEKGFKPRSFHYMMSRFWDGSWRVPVVEGNRTIGFGAGKTRPAAIAKAEAIAAENPAWRTAAPRTVSELDQDMALVSGINEQDAKLFGQAAAKVVSKTAPKRLVKQRKGAVGYVGYAETWTKNDVKNMILKQLRGYQLYNAKISFEHQFEDIYSRLKSYAPDIAEQVVLRTRAIFGEPGPLAKIIDHEADRFLSPWFGVNSASKIAGEMNKAVFRLSLGFLNTGFNIANALTFVQTAYPHIAMLATAAPTRLMPYYTMWPVQGLKAVDGVGMLDMLKLTGRSFARLGAKADDELRQMTERAVADGTIAPRFVEAWVGQKAENFVRLNEVLQGKEPVGAWLASVADFLPSLTEKFARGHSFVLGQTFFKEIMGVEDPELLYQLSKRFVENTQFLYGTEDRARIITGPLGASFGLFKNWMMHYIGWWAVYTGEGVGKGNWAPLMWAGATTAGLGGVGALPLFGAADAMSQWLGNPSALLQLNEVFGDRKELADGIYYGLPAFAGFTLQHQVAAPFADIGSDASFLMSFAVWDRMKYVQKLGGALIDNYKATGTGPGHDQRSIDLFMRAFAPKSVYQAAQAVQEGAIRSFATGNPTTDLSPAQRLALAVSLGTPVELAKAYQVQRELRDNQDALRAAVSRYGRAWAESVDAQRYDETLDIMRRAMMDGVDLQSVVRSGKSYQAKGRENAIDRQFSLSSTVPYRDAGLLP